MMSHQCPDLLAQLLPFFSLSAEEPVTTQEGLFLQLYCRKNEPPSTWREVRASLMTQT